MASVDPDREQQPASTWLGDVSRRAFIGRGTLTAAAIGAVGTIPGLSGLLASGASAVPETEEGFADADGEAGALAQPLVAHVKDINTGEISLFQGEREIPIRDPALARRLLASARP
jgi:hypothetical protein